MDLLAQSDGDGEAWVDPEPLHAAAAAGDLDAVRRLVADGWDVNAFDTPDGRQDVGLGLTPLHEAARNEHLDVAAFLIAAGADVNALDERCIGRPPLADVAPTCSLAMAQLLVAAGADPTLQIGLSRSALQMAAERKRFEGPEVYALFVEAARRLGHLVGKPKRRS